MSDVAQCGNCNHWCPFNQVYEDDLEPDDCGFCYVKVKSGGSPEGTNEDYWCDKWAATDLETNPTSKTHDQSGREGSF